MTNYERRFADLADTLDKKYAETKFVESPEWKNVRTPCTKHTFLSDPECLTCQEWNHSKGDPTLQLLVIDLGDSCVVKVEKGHGQPIVTDPGKTAFDVFGENAVRVHNVIFTDKPFAKLRTAIDALGEKPVPRIEQRGDTPHFKVFTESKNANGEFDLWHDRYQALSELAGHPLPVWQPKNGTWDEIVGRSMAFGDPVEISPNLAIWRYTLREGE